MKISAAVKNSKNSHSAIVTTNGDSKRLQIDPKSVGQGSSINGGELLFLALATCYCNDIYREAETVGIVVNTLEVNVAGKFEGRGAAASEVSFDVSISADASVDEVEALLKLTDGVAEIQNSMRLAVPVSLGNIEIL